MNTRKHKWIHRLNTNPTAQLRLFCFPYAGGGASIYRLWPKEMPRGIEVCPIQLPGRENRLRETPHQQVTTLVRALLPELTPHLDRPFAFFGYSMGTSIAYELTCQLEANHYPTPKHLLVAARRAPHIPPLRPLIHHLPDTAFLRALRTQYGGIPDAVWRNRELMEIFLPLLRADFVLTETYTPQPKIINTPITAIAGLSDPHTSKESLMAWESLTNADFQLRWIAGEHFFINTQRRALLNIISEVLLG